MRAVCYSCASYRTFRRGQFADEDSGSSASCCCIALRWIRPAPRARQRGRCVFALNQKQCSRQLQCEVPSSICFLSRRSKEEAVTLLLPLGTLACQVLVLSALYARIPYIGGMEVGGQEGTGTSGPGCLYGTTTRTRCLPQRDFAQWPAQRCDARRIRHGRNARW